MKKFLKTILANIMYFIGHQKIPDIFNNINIETTSRCNLKCKFCAYDKRDLLNVPYTTMSLTEFQDIVLQSLDLGYKNIGLTPTTGDVFMDKEIINKLIFLDNQKQLDGYYFYTNFIPLDEIKISQLYSLKKLTNLGISIYGSDLESFLKLSGGTAKAYEKLIKNLTFLKKIIVNSKPNFKIEIALRTVKDFKIESSTDQISLIIKKLIKEDFIEFSQNSEFNNWGGLIEDKDVKNLGIRLKSKKINKIGSCSLIYSRLIVGANGKVNACACRDANFTLAIGDLKQKKLREIINYKNPTYKNLILRQEKNDFPDVCKACDFYRSIYQNNNFVWSFKDKRIKHFSLKNIIKILDAR